MDIRRFPWIKPLAADYAYAFDRLADFYAGNPADEGAWRDAIARAQRFPRERQRTAAVIRAQQTRRGTPAQAIAAADRLATADTVAVVTGQQAGLFGGPVYTLLKAISAIQLARETAARHHVPVIPIFWVDAEDHDWDEVKACGLLDDADNLVSVAVGDLDGESNRPVGWITLDDSVSTSLDALEAVLSPGDSTPELLSGLRRAYQPGTRMADAFAQWLETLLGPLGLVVFDSSDAAAKPLVAELFAREVESNGRTARLAAQAGAALTSRGYHEQVTPAEGSVALFELDAGRVPIRVHDGRFVVGSRTLTADALAAEIRQSPERFSPNVLLRPLVQDTLFPTVSYVAGPNELAYLGQLRGVYSAFDVPMPLMSQRSSATFLDTNATRFLAKCDVPLEELRARDEATLNQLLAAQLPAAVEATLQDAIQSVTDRMEALAGVLPQIDATLEGAARSVLGRMQDDLKKLHGKIIQAAKRKDDTLRRQFTHAQAQAFPGGDPQERALGLVYLLNKSGLGVIARIAEDVTPDPGVHWVVTL